MSRSSKAYTKGSTRDYTEEGTPVAVYCIEKKKCVAVLSSVNIAAKFLYDDGRCDNMQGWNIRRNITNKWRIGNSRFEKWLAVRYANAEQKELLNGEKFIILDSDYAIPTKHKIT